METNLELEEQYRNHKVVAFPNPRRCTTVRELAAANNSKCAASNNSLSPSQRARSLSAGRGRHRSSNEILQDVYDRASVSIRQGPSSNKGKGTTGEEMAPPPLTANNLVNNQDITQEMSPGVVPLGAFDGENYQARYRNAVAARDMVREPVSTETESQEQRRSRSLSRGRPQLAKRWPPLTVKQEESDPAGVAAAAPTIAVNHSNSPKRLVGVASPKRTLGSQNTPQRGQVELSSSYEYSSEEKKEDSAEQHFHGTPSIKERISVYGKSGSNTKSKNLSGLRRTVDPSYAAQFHALRVQPPKIDIYEGNKDKDEKEDFDSSSIVGELLWSMLMHQQQSQTRKMSNQSYCHHEIMASRRLRFQRRLVRSRREIWRMFSCQPSTRSNHYNSNNSSNNSSNKQPPLTLSRALLAPLPTVHHLQRLLLERPLI